jgi:Pyridoxamine 5'-phosphate oxidase
MAPEPAPPRAENCTYQYDDNALQPADPDLVIPWADAVAQLAGAGTYWSATLRPDGRPHVRPVFAVWVDNRLCTTSNPTARKGRNLAGDGRCAYAAPTDGIDFVVEGTAGRITDPDLLDRVADAYRSKYGWPVTVVDGAFDAPFGAPAAGPPPYQPYAIMPHTIYGFGTDERFAHASTRWRF